eukprot:TRINITY_DN2120_c0_g1_i1.p1 TRINITY_DN2120_c0_g1~~TRINITY_DN2120_c0_g1_i1.p1  ORF type:complete len:279 (+),score=56.85 TRINITY_DN2120_c0_g1_i1:96-839(+)
MGLSLWILIACNALLLPATSAATEETNEERQLKGAGSGGGGGGGGYYQNNYDTYDSYDDSSGGESSSEEWVIAAIAIGGMTAPIVGYFCWTSYKKKERAEAVTNCLNKHPRTRTTANQMVQRNGARATGDDDYSRAWICDLCGKQSGFRDEHFERCESCKYDFCTACITALGFTLLADSVDEVEAPKEADNDKDADTKTADNDKDADTKTADNDKEADTKTADNDKEADTKTADNDKEADREAGAAC